MILGQARNQVYWAPNQGALMVGHSWDLTLLSMRVNHKRKNQFKFYAMILNEFKFTFLVIILPQSIEFFNKN